MDPLRIKLYVFLKGLVPMHSIGLVDIVYLWPYKVFYYNADFLYKRRY